MSKRPSKLQKVKNFDFKNAKPSELGEWQVRNCGEEDVDPTTLIDNPYNVNEHKAEQLAIWREFVAGSGFLGRVIVNKKNRHIIEGHMRTEDARQRKIKTIPVQWVWIDTLKEEKKIVSVYQRIGENAIINRARLGENLSDIQDELGALAKNFFAKLPDLQTMGEQMLAEGASLFDEPGDSDAFFNDDDSPESEFEDPFASDGGGAPKARMPKIVLHGEASDEFRRLLARHGKSGELGANSKALLILSN
jgi:hypothetical protein